MDERPTANSGTLRGVSGHFSEKYTDAQRDAIASAVLDRGAKYKRAVELAAAGELTTPDGDRLDPFTFKLTYVGTVVDREKRRRVGVKTTVAALEPRDAVEVLRRNLVDVMDDEMRHLKKAKSGTRDPEKLRQFARALRELQAIPGPKEGARPAPGAKDNGKREGGETRGGMSGELLKANRASRGPTAPETYTAQGAHTEKGAAGGRSTHEAQQDEAAEGDGAPGSVARAVATQLATA